MFIAVWMSRRLLVLFLCAMGFGVFTVEDAISGEIDPLLTQSEGNAIPLPLDCLEEIDPNKSYALGDVIHLALCHNPKTKDSWAQFLASRDRLGSARGSYLPSINAELDYNNSNSGKAYTSAKDKRFVTTSGALTLDYLLFDFGQREASVEAIRQNLLEANYTHNLSLQQVIFGALEAYYDFYGATAALEAAQESEASSLVSFKAASLRLEIGAASVIEKLKAETAHEQAILARVLAENTLVKAKGRLLDNVGFDASAAIALEAPQAQDPKIEKFEQDVGDLIKTAKIDHPSLLADKARVAAKQSVLDRTKRQRLPSITLNGSMGETNGISGTSIDNEDESTIGVHVSIPLFSGFSRSYDIRAAKHDLKSAQAKQEQNEHDVSLDIWESYQDLNTIGQNVQTTATLLASASEAEKVALARYKAGAGSLIDLLDAQAQLASARQQRVSATYNWYVAKANLLRAMGKMSSE